MASDFYGPYVLENGHLGALVIGRAIKGKSAQIVANPDLLHTFTFINDMAEDLVTLATDDRANGQTWHVRNAPPQSFREVIRLLGKLLDQNIKIQTLPKPLLRVAGWFNKDIAEVQEMLYQFHNPFVISDNKFRQTFGGQATSLEAGLQETIEWYKKQEGK
jgi:nucleoside-diphosphate-sugar epimerase